MARTKRPAFAYAPGSDWCHSDVFEDIEKGAEYASEYSDTPSQTPCEGFPTFKMTLETLKSKQHFRFVLEEHLFAFISYLENIHGTKA